MAALGDCRAVRAGRQAQWRMCVMPRLPLLPFITLSCRELPLVALSCSFSSYYSFDKCKDSNHNEYYWPVSMPPNIDNTQIAEPDENTNDDQENPATDSVKMVSHFFLRCLRITTASSTDISPFSSASKGFFSPTGERSSFARRFSIFCFMVG